LDGEPVLIVHEKAVPMHICPARNDEDNEDTLRELEAPWSAKQLGEADDRPQALATLVEVYESQHLPNERLDPVPAMEMNGYDRTVC
jgi:antitoxin component HigA of HigAB toxin-antitoxin module